MYVDFQINRIFDFHYIKFESIEPQCYCCILFVCHQILQKIGNNFFVFIVKSSFSL